MANLEIACFNEASAIIAFEGGAQRVELCKDKATEGITPNLETIKRVRAKINIPLHVMVRPRAGSYLYSEKEMEQMRQEILALKNLGIDGLVLGALNQNFQLHPIHNAQMVEWAFPLHCHFHRAFDEVLDMQKALEDCIALGFKTILTSGNTKRAIDSQPQLLALVQQGKERIEIMPGGGIRSAHVKELVKVTGAKWVHSSGITDSGEIANLEEVKQLKNQLLWE